MGRRRTLHWVLPALVLVLVISGCAGGSSDDQSVPEAPFGSPDVKQGACRLEEPPTAGNRVIWFVSDVQQGRDPTITGGVEHPWRCAYDQLCPVIRANVSEEEFRGSRGVAVSPLLAADSFAGSRTGPYEYRPGVDEERPDLETVAPDLVSTWKDFDVTWLVHIDDRTVVSGAGRVERWRVNLVREDGDWRVCGFEKRPA